MNKLFNIKHVEETRASAVPESLALSIECYTIKCKQESFAGLSERVLLAS